MLGSHTRTNQDGLSRGHRYDRDVHANDGDDVGHPSPVTLTRYTEDAETTLATTAL